MDRHELARRIHKATEDSDNRGQRALDAIRKAGFVVRREEPPKEALQRGQAAAHSLGGRPAKLFSLNDIGTIWRAMLKEIDDAD